MGVYQKFKKIIWPSGPSVLASQVADGQFEAQ
jgi:hypothetical protein